MISTIVLGSLLGLAVAGAALSPKLKEWFPGAFAPKKGGG